MAALTGADAQTPAQRKHQASVLDVPGARLYYEVRGSGPVMLMVTGASGTGDSFLRVAEYLVPHFTVVTYDRRGFSRSKLVGPQDEGLRLKTDADDVRSLVEHIGEGPAIVFGSSSGAIVGLEAMTRHPPVVRRLVPHEPPAVKLLADGQKWIDFFFEVYGLYRQSGIEPALKTFRERAFAELDRQTMARAPRNDYTLANATYWFEHELRQYPTVDLELEALKAHAGRIVLTAGRESHGYPSYEVSVELAKRLGLHLNELPGAHLGFLSHPAEFACELVRALSQ